MVWFVASASAWAAEGEATATGTVRDGILHVEVSHEVAAIPQNDAGARTIPLPTRSILTGFRADGPATLRGGARGAVLTVPPGAPTRQVSWTLEIAPYTHGLWVFAPDELPVRTIVVDGVARAVDRGQIWIPSEDGAQPEASFGVVQVGDTALTHLVVQVPQRLSPPAPAGLSVVHLVDRSCSQGDEGVRRQLATVAALLDLLPDAEHAVLAWDRAAAPVWDGFVRGADAELPDTLPLAQGTDPAAALAAASAALGDRPGPRRVVWFTDRLYPRAVDEAALAGGLPRDAAVHVVVTDGRAKYGAYWAPTREAPLVDLARGGIAGYALLREPERVARALARPVTVEHAEVAVDGAAQPAWRLEPLDEGRVVSAVQVVPHAPSRVDVRGYAWAEPWTVAAQRSAQTDAEAARWVWADLPELPEPVERALGRRAPVLNPWRSLRSDGRTTRWVPDEPAETFGGGGTGTGSPPPPIVALDAERVRAALDLAVCARPLAAPAEVTLDLDLTYDEIAAATVRSPDPALSACVEAALWRSRLDPAAFPDRRAAGVLTERLVPPTPPTAPVGTASIARPTRRAPGLTRIGAPPGGISPAAWPEAAPGVYAPVWATLDAAVVPGAPSDAAAVVVFGPEPVRAVCLTQEALLAPFDGGPPTEVPPADLRVRARPGAVRLDVDLAAAGLAPDGGTLWVAGCEAGVVRP